MTHKPSTNPQMTLSEFRDEMQHLVVKHGPRSRQVRDTLRFARKNLAPEFYRVATDKIHAQQQYHREVYGPSHWERTLDFVNMGSLREVAATLVLVTIACGGIEAVRTRLGARPAPDPVSAADVERMAERMGFYLADDIKQARQEEARLRASHPLDTEVERAQFEQIVAKEVAAGVAKSQIGQLTARKVNESLESKAIEKLLLDKLSAALDSPAVRQAIAARVQEQLPQTVSTLAEHRTPGSAVGAQGNRLLILGKTGN